MKLSRILLVVPLLPMLATFTGFSRMAGSNVIEVKCLDLDGNPINRVTVKLWSASTNKVSDKRTNKEGLARFDKLDDDYFRVWASPEGFEPTYKEFIEAIGGGTQSVTLQFSPGDDQKLLYFENQQAITQLNQFLQEGSAALQSGRAAEAEAKFKAAVESFPAEPNAHYNLAYAFLQQGKFDEARASLEKLQELLKVYTRTDPSNLNFSRQNADAEELIASLPLRKLAFNIDQSMTQRDFEGALESLQQLVDLQPNNSNAYYTMAIALSQLNRLDDAVEKLDKALAIDPNEQAFKDLKGRIAQIKEDRKQNELKLKVAKIQELVGEEKYAEALALCPDALQTVPEELHPDIWVAKANAHLALEQYPEFLEAFVKQLELKSEPVDESLYKLGQDFVRRGKQAQARDVFETLLKVNPNYAEAYYQLGMDYFYEAGDKVKAKQMLEKYLELGQDENNLNNAKNVLIVIEKS